MLKKFKYSIILIGALILVLLLTSGVLCGWYFSDDYSKSEVTVSFSYAEGVENNYIAKQSIKLVQGEAPIMEIPLKDVTDSLEVTFSDYSVWDYISGSQREFNAHYLLNCELLYDTIEPLYVEGKDAYIEYTESGVVLVPEDKGREFAVDEVIELIQLNPDYNTPIDISDLIVSDVTTQEDLKKTYDELAWVNTWHVSYSDGYAVDYAYMYPYIKGNTDVDWTEAVAHITNAYTTSDDSTVFTCTNGDTITVANKTYGYTVSDEDVLEFLQTCWNNKESCENCIPCRSGYGDMNDTYIEISIADQHVWHYVNGTLCCDADTVTGTKGENDTPTGVYYISECIDGKYLRGADYVTWVDKWMRITNRGHGLHDASWRRSFGGNIYTYNGSHGCINLPKSFAYNLFDEVSVGDRVVIY